MSSELDLVKHIERLEALVTRLETLFSPGVYPVKHGTGDVDWSRYPAMLTPKHIAELYGFTIKTVSRKLAQYDPDVPYACRTRPIRVRRGDCQRHFESLEQAWVIRMRKAHRRDRS